MRRYRGPLVAFAAAIVSADGAEDVVQASLEKANRALRADSREIALRPWLFAIVRNGALNAVRREPRVDELGEAMAIAAGPGEIAEQRDDLDRLVVAMCALPEAQRQALVKRELEGVGHGEIAAQLGTTATAVRGLIFRARTGLRNALGAAVPLPVLRSLLTEGAAAGAAGGGASVALLGGVGAKGGSVVAAAVIALGAGIAVDQSRRGGDGGGVAEATAAPSDADRKSSAGGSSSGAAPEGAPATVARDDAVQEGGSDQDLHGTDEGGSGGAGGSGLAASEQEGRSGEDGSGTRPDGDVEAGQGGSGGGGGSSGSGGGHQGSPPPPPPPDDDDHSGSGGGGGEEPEPLEPIEPPDDDDGGGGGHSGPGGGEEPEPVEPIEPPDDDSSGSGSGQGGSGSGEHDD